MKKQQKLNIKSVDNDQKSSNLMKFSIQLDTGNLYIPGQLYCKSEHSAIYCRGNCGAEFRADGISYRLQRGDILLIKPGVPFGVVAYSRNEEQYGGFVVSAGEEYVDYLLEQMGRDLDYPGGSKLIHTRGTLWENIDTLFAAALEESELKATGWEAALLGCSMMLLVQIARAAASDPNANVSLEKPDLLTGILAYVENNLAEKITLEDVANRFFVSASTVTHLFNKKMNISFYKYVMQYRLWKAQNLIKEGMAMEKIAAQVGFNDYSAFYRAFKQEFGMSPRQYYKENLDK